MRVVVMARVSTEGQAESGVSLDAQVEQCRAYAALYGLEVIAVVQDRGVSGKTLNRPGLKRALVLLKRGDAQGLLIQKLDRLTRRVADLGYLLENFFGERGGHALFSVSEQIRADSASGRLLLNLLISVAAWEREAAGERTKTALAHLRKQGVVLGRPGYGWRRSTERDEHGRLGLVEVDEEQSVVRRILALHQEGASLSSIARTLNDDEVPGQRGGNWSHKIVGRVVRRAKGEGDEAAGPG